MTDWKDTVNLPRTAFPMKANLPQTEPQVIARWEAIDLYARIRAKRAGAPKYVLHDGPPYANGRIHLGTALNKVLKDFVVKARTMAGYDSPYVPGWDCHGLPIELKVDRELGPKKRQMSVADFRRACRAYAARFVDIQRADFKRLGVVGAWSEPYLTMNYGYQVSILHELGKFASNKLIYKGKKPVHWCSSCATALAEAEVEYADKTSAGIRLAAGEECSYFAEGRVYANRFLDIFVDPAVQLWARVGEEGEIFRGTRSAHSFRAHQDGELFFGNYFPNDWADARGRRVQDDGIYADMSGGMRILVLRWAGSARDGLRALADAGDHGGRVLAEVARIGQGDTTPPGWHYLWHLGPAEIYRAQQLDAGSCIHCRTRGDVGILQKNVELPLDESTAISWRWRVERLPSKLREDSLPSHDYLSLPRIDSSRASFPSR